MRWTSCLVGWILLALLPAPCRGKVDPEAVNRAIDRGVALLKQKQEREGGWTRLSNGGAGMTALAGLTLLHCGVPATDPSVVKAAAYVRRIFRQKDAEVFASLGNLLQTYSVSLTILFLDRLGDGGDEALIRKLTAWLIAGQMADGGWGYGLAFAVVPQGDAAGAVEGPDTTDNSNTQFAMLALWAGQRHGVRVSRSLAAAAKRFYVSQGRDGGWPYSPFRNPREMRPVSSASSTLSMTCAGLLALAFRHASANKAILQSQTGRPALARAFHDAAVVAGFTYVRENLKPALAEDTLLDRRDVNTYYVLWSVERVAAAYDLATIGEVDWYNGAVQLLLAKQKNDGGWQGSWGLADTCFALLVLRRANLSPDMTAYLKGQLPPRTLVWTMPLKKTAEHEPDLTRKDVREALRQTAASVEKKPDDTAIQALVKQLEQADAFQRDRLLRSWRDGDDERYTRALAKGIAILRGPAERKVRAALADRLTRLTVHERDEHLRSDDPEIRRAAVLSCAVRDDHQHLARLIELLQDKETPVAHAAHAVLCSLTGQDFGPNADTTQTHRDRAVAAWKEWALRAAADKVQKKKSRP